MKRQVLAFISIMSFSSAYGAHSEKIGVIIEDTNAGITAAISADMTAIAVPNAFTNEHDFSHATCVDQIILHVGRTGREVENMLKESETLVPCLSCAFQEGKLETIGGVIASTNYFEARQDCYVPIPGFVILYPKRHVQAIDEFTPEERADFIEFVCLMRKKMREKLSIKIVYIFQQEDSSHFHLLLFPRYDWMSQVGKSIQSIKPVMHWAQENLNTEEGLRQVGEAIEKLKY